MDDNQDLLSSLLSGNPGTEEIPPEENAPSVQPLDTASLDASLESAEEAPPEEAPLENQLNDEMDATRESMGANFTEAPAESHEPAADSTANFSVILRNFSKKTAEVAKLLDSLDLKAPRPEDLTQGHALLMSRLDEYRAIVLAQGAWQLGLCPEFKVSSNASDESEMDPNHQTIGAPSVEFLPGTTGVWIGTVQNVPGANLLESFGLVSYHRAIPRRFFRQTDAEQSLLADIQKLNLPQTVAENHYEALLQDLTRELQVAALAKGANAVVGVELEFFPELHGMDKDADELRVVLSGTAVKLTQAVDLPLNSL